MITVRFRRDAQGVARGPETFEERGPSSPYLRYEEQFAIVTDTEGRQHAYPVDRVEEIIVDAPRRW